MHKKPQKKQKHTRPALSKQDIKNKQQAILDTLIEKKYDLSEFNEQERRHLIFAITASPQRVTFLAKLLMREHPSDTFTVQGHANNQCLCVNSEHGDIPLLSFTRSMSNNNFKSFIEDTARTYNSIMRTKESVIDILHRIKQHNAVLNEYSIKLSNAFLPNAVFSYLMSGTKPIRIRLGELSEKLEFEFNAMISNAKYHAHLNSTCDGNWITHQYQNARSMKRHFVIYSGPTNSGKTYSGLKHFTRENKGIYLAPLRLLALETKERIDEEIAPCDLVTGEETILSPNACHVASTIEMLSPDKTYDVAFIDEGQMLRDPQRGSSWTRAIMGVAAKTVVVATAPDAVPTLKKLIQLTGDTVEVHTLVRKTELHINTKRLTPDMLASDEYKHTAIVAFSRKDVLNIAGYYRNLGVPTSAIYGAMPPDARRTQAELFKQSEHTLLVATDAIAMGLNLPIKHVVFANTEKYNGTEVVNLDDPLIKQIAGRAGRFGLYESGHVGFMLKAKGELIQNALETDIPDTPFKVRIRPENDLLLSIAQKLDTENLNEILSGFFAFTSNTDMMLPDNLKEPRALAKQHAELLSEFSLKDALSLCFAPLAPDRREDNALFTHTLNQILNNDIVSFNTFMSKSVNYSVDNASLSEAEFVSRMGGIYHFFHKRFPSVFNDMEHVTRTREKCAIIIGEQLSVLANPQCQRCKKPVPPMYPHKECDTCHKARAK